MNYKLTDTSIYRVSIKGIVIKNNEVLLIQEGREIGGNWTMLGGGLDHDEESHIDCLKREVREETNLIVTEVSDRPLFIIRSYMANVKTHKLDIVYQIEVKDLNFKRSDECTDLQFFTLKEMESLPMLDNGRQLRKLLQGYLKS